MTNISDAQVFSHEGITLYCGDCLDLLRDIEEPIDQIVTSPPFNAGKEYERGEWETLKDYHDWLLECFGALWSICATGAWLTIEIQDMHVSPEHSHSLPGQKEQFNMATSAQLIVGLIRQGWYFKGDVIWNRGRWMNNMANKMACGLIQGWSLPNSTILDPFSGSGTTLRAAKDLGRQAIGVEREPLYCQASIGRLQQDILLPTDCLEYPPGVPVHPPQAQLF